MPVARPYTSFGNGNGFPFIPPSAEITGVDYWITLGGYSRDDYENNVPVTQDQIDLSLVNAMKLYRLLHKFSSQLTVGENAPEVQTVFASTVQPDEREVDRSFGTEVLYTQGSFLRFLAGGTFVGYGVNAGVASGLTTGTANSYGQMAFNSLFNHAASGANFAYDFAYTNITGIPYVVRAFSTSDFAFSVDAASKTITTTGTTRTSKASYTYAGGDTFEFWNASEYYNISRSSVSGIGYTGQTLTATPGVWSAGTVVTGQWLSNGIPIAGATELTYVVAAEFDDSTFIYEETGNPGNIVVRSSNEV